MKGDELNKLEVDLLIDKRTTDYTVPTIGIILLCYNQEGFIEQSLQGIWNQVIDVSVEILIADDCSTDDTSSVISTFIEKNDINFSVKYYRQRSNKGMMNNFAFALTNVRGKYFALCEGDDFWTSPLKLAKQFNYLEKNENVNICFHEVKIINQENKEIKDDIYKRLEGLDIKKLTRNDLLRRGNFMHTVSVMYRNQELSLPPEFYQSTVGDYFIHILLSNTGLISKLEEKMAIYRRGTGVYSALGPLEMTNKIIRYQAVLLSWISDRNGREILQKKLMNSINGLENLMGVVHQSPRALSKSLSWQKIVKIIVFKLLKK
jgi:glycosyltransferase involved in cell wall biosynthesis